MIAGANGTRDRARKRVVAMDGLNLCEMLDRTLHCEERPMDDQARFYLAKLQYEIDPWDLNEALERGDKIHLVDTRSAEAYGRSHIPGAVNIPHRTMTTATTAHLDKAALIVTYCDGIRCNGSTKGALNMVQLGFRVKELIGGLDCWRYDGYAIDGSEPAPPAGSCGCS